MEMKKNPLLYIVAANLAVLLVLAVLYPHLMIEPGKLMAGHEALETDCFACHSPFIGSRPAKCVQCHAPAEIGLVTTQGLPIAGERKLGPFHQKLIETDCVACHSDHKGVQSFRPIGQFSHGLLQAGLRAQCSGCHARPGDSLHRDLTANCADCHSDKAWRPATLDHDQFFRLDSEHRAECRTCHMNQSYEGYTCYGCHEHSRAGIRAEHVEEGIYDYENCVECHRSGDAEADEHGAHRESGKHGRKDRDDRENDEREGGRGWRGGEHEHEHEHEDDD
ncbi:class III cytochrome C family protein [Thiorhodococcus mannitoliphagus]|uniref:Class III cytochrome C family protein n=2 Tax=Thiorhodococcus mannitoliphagus TaxID=329406 RepID=A0A6P1DW41_9GAMM|nr:class III cytochrome C family protein [Thiorhodococcus mannitoliphagus]